MHVKFYQSGISHSGSGYKLFSLPSCIPMNKEMAQLDAADSMPGLFSYKTIVITFLLNFFIEIEIHKNA